MLMHMYLMHMYLLDGCYGMVWYDGFYGFYGMVWYGMMDVWYDGCMV